MSFYFVLFAVGLLITGGVLLIIGEEEQSFISEGGIDSLSGNIESAQGPGGPGSLNLNGAGLSHNYKNYQTDITAYALLNGNRFDITSYLNWWFVEVSNTTQKWGTNFTIPQGAVGNNIVNNLDYIVFNVSLKNNTIHSLDRYGVRYLDTCTTENLVETCSYIKHDFYDIVRLFQNNLNQTIPLIVTQESPNTALITLDLTQAVFSIGQVIELDPTISIDNVNSYVSTKTNVTTEAAPLAHITTLNESLLLYMPFDYRNYNLENVSAITEYDYTPYNINGAINAAGRTNWTSLGFIGGAYVFDARDDDTGGIDLGSNNLLNFSMQSFTISAWTNARDVSGRRTIFSRGSLGGGNIAQYGIETFNGFYRFTINNFTSTLTSTSPSMAVPNEWHHIAGTWNGSETRLYLDGSLVDSDVMPANFYDNGLNTAAANAPTGIGGDVRNLRNYYNGTLDEVMVLNQSLSAAQIAEIFNNQTVRFRGPEASQLFNGVNISQDGNLNRINVTVNTTQNFGTSMQLRLRGANLSNDNIENTTWQTIPDGSMKLLGFNISTNVFNVSLEFNYTYSANKFYTPILRDNIIIDSWASGAAPVVFNPNVTNLTENPADPATYSPGAFYNFNATVVDDGTIDTVLFEFDGINYSTSNSLSIYNKSFIDLGAGTYNYLWYANDTDGNVNNSEGGTYTINRAASLVNLTLDHVQSNITLFQWEAIWLNGTLITGDSSNLLQMYLDGDLINQGLSPISNFTNFTSLGLFNVTLIYSQSQNYTSNFETLWVEVIANPEFNPNVTNLQEPTNPSTYVNGAIYQFNATVKDDGIIDTVLFQFDGVNYSTSLIAPNIYSRNMSGLAAGTYPYLWYANDTQGNVNNSETGSFTINKASGLVFTYINGVRNHRNIANDSLNTNLTGIRSLGDPSATLRLYVNGSLWNVGTSPITNYSNFTLPGVYLINVTMEATQNYTFDFEAWNLTVSVPTPPSNVTVVGLNVCSYRKLGYYNPRLPALRLLDCI